MKKHNWARKVAWILCLSLLLTCLPSYSFAESEGTATTMAVEQSTGESEGDKASEAKTAKEKKSEAKKEDTEKSAASEASEKKSDEKADSDKAAEKKTEAGKAEEKSGSSEKSDGGSQGESKTDDKSGSDKADERTTEKQSGETASEAKSESKTDSGKTDEKSEGKTDSEKTDSDSSDKKDDADKADDGDQADEQSTEKDDADKSEASEATDETPVFKARMKFATLKRYAKEAPEKVAEDKKTSVRIYEDGDYKEDYDLKCGKISEKTDENPNGNVPHRDGKEYEGAFVVTYEKGTDESGNEIEDIKNEDEIKYIDTYTETDAEGNEKKHVYYAFSDTPDTGILLNENQYIKLVYRTVYPVSYEVRQGSVDGTVLNKDGTLGKDGTAKMGSGGGFKSAATKLEKGDDLNLQFQEEKNAGKEGKDYVLKEMYLEAADGTKTKIETDSSNMAKIEAEKISGAVKLIAVVEPVEKYKLIVTNTSSGHVCWAGHGDEKNSNTAAPYSVDASKFCSYDTDGTVTGTKGATVTADPNGTIYWVMYSQTGSKWQLQHLIVNGVYVDTTCDGKVHDTDLGNGMTAHFQYIGDEKKDSHLKDNARAERSKFACWVTNVSSDIKVDFECESEKRETLTLVQADGIQQVVASTYDRAGIGFLAKNYWDGIYNGDNNQKEHSGQKFPNMTLTGSDIGKDLVNEYWSRSKDGHRNSDNKHTSVEDKKSDGYGSRYVYFKTKAGYDPVTLRAKISGQSTELQALSITQLATNTYKKDLFGWITTEDNKSVKTAKDQGYNWFVTYEGVGQYFRQLSLSASPYKYAVTYDLQGGKIDGADTYTDSNSGNYTIEDGKNRIIMPLATPTKEGYVFQGWKLIPTNEKYKDADLGNTLDVAGRFEINATTYEYGLVTEKTTYTLDKTTYTDYNPVSGGAHTFAFQAQWVKEDDTTSTKANYTITAYREITKTAYDALAENARTTKNGKYYQKISGPTTHVGTVGETVIGIPADPEVGYVLSDDSVTKLENFKETGNTATELIYYYDVVHTLTVKKTATGDYADKTKEFSVTVTVKDAQDKALTGSYDATGEADNVKDGKITFTNGTATLLLKDSESVTISGLPTGTYSVSETLSTDVDKKNYTATYSVDGATATDTAPSNQALKFDLNTDNKVKNAASSVTITNTRCEETPTGVVDGQSPNGMLAAILVLFAAVIAMRKRGLFEYLGQEIKGRGRDRQK